MGNRLFGNGYLCLCLCNYFNDRYFVNSNLLNCKIKLLLHQTGAGVSALEEIVLVSVVNIIFRGIVIFQNEQAFKVNHISTFGVG